MANVIHLQFSHQKCFYPQYITPLLSLFSAKHYDTVLFTDLFLFCQVFHKTCVLPWIRGGKSCPLGRCLVPAAARAGKREMSFLQPKSVGKTWEMAGNQRAEAIFSEKCIETGSFFFECYGVWSMCIVERKAVPGGLPGYRGVLPIEKGWEAIHSKKLCKITHAKILAMK